MDDHGISLVHANAGHELSRNGSGYIEWDEFRQAAGMVSPGIISWESRVKVIRGCGSKPKVPFL